MRISTNILRDAEAEFDYIVTENTQSLFEHLDDAMEQSGGCFNLIGSYGTGKSSFLLALEQTLQGRKAHFKWTPPAGASYQVIKLLGQPESIVGPLNKALGLRANAKLNKTLDTLLTWSKGSPRSMIFVDELGKFVEYALQNDPKKETYAFQQIAELVNDGSNSLTWVGTLHQNIDGYAAGIAASDAAEWEKVSGRFQTLNFNEPATTLLKLCAARLEGSGLKADKKKIAAANKTTRKAQILPPAFQEQAEALTTNLVPFDALGAFFTISVLQKYGQNERSVFSFLEAKGPGSLQDISAAFYSPSDLHRHVTDRLSHFVFSNANPDKLSWEACERAIQRADSHSEINPIHARFALHTVLLASIFGKEGASFDTACLAAYVRSAFGKEAGTVVEQLIDKNIVQFLRHRGKLAFVEGTDVNLHLELIEAGKHIPVGTDLLAEAASRIELSPRLNKSHFIQTGTPRFVHTTVSSPDDIKVLPQVPSNLACTVILGSEERMPWGTPSFPVVEVLVSEVDEVRSLTLDILRYERILEKYQDDLVVKQLVAQERNYCIVGLKQALENSLYDEGTTWYCGDFTYTEVHSETLANRVFAEILKEHYPDAPEVHNELVNQEKLSASVNTARKSLFKAILNRAAEPSLGFREDKFPAEKSVFHSTWIKEGMYNFAKGTLSSPNKGSSYVKAWTIGTGFLEQAKSGKVSLSGLFDQLRDAPFGMKQGFLSYWVPMFLMTVEDEFSLFYLPENKYLPYLSVDIFESILRHPDQFAIKALNIQGVSQATLNQYRELAQVDPNRSTAQSTYIGIFTNFISLHRSLNGYALRTKTISPEALALRTAIEEAPDPETALFESIPAALGHHQISATENEEAVQAYFAQLKETARELAGCYGELLNRIEVSVRKAFQCPGGDFADLKQDINENLQGVDASLLAPRLRTLYQRLTSPLDDRESWIKSVGDAILGRSLEQLEDKAEPLLHQHTQDAIASLLAQRGLIAQSEASVAVAITTSDGNRIERYVPIADVDTARHTDLLAKLDGMSSKDRLSLVALILESENELSEWQPA